MSNYRLSRQADLDLDGIANYIAAANPAAAVDVLDAIHNTFAFLAANPDAGKLREDLRPGLRIFSPQRPAHSYVVFYYCRDNCLEIITVIHGAQDWLTMFRRGET